jgi:PAS domain S-box-containing protein
LGSYAHAAALVCATLGVVVLIGWTVDSPLLKGAIAAPITVKPNTAVCFIAAALALWLALQSGDRPQFFRNVAAALVAGIAALTIIEYAADVSVGIDELLFRDSARASLDQSGGRMGLPASASFLLIGASLLLTDVRTRAGYVFRYLPLLATAIAMVSLAGYAFGSPALYAHRPWTQIAWPTAVALVVLSTGVVAARPDNRIARTLCAENVGGTVARQLILPALVLPFVLLYAYSEARDSEFVDAARGRALLAVIMMITQSAIVLVTAHRLAVTADRQSRAEAALRKSEQDLSDFFDNAAVGLHWVDVEGTILRANRADMEMIGYTPGEYVGRSIAEFYADPREIEDILRRLAAGETLRDHPARLRHKNGSIRDVHVTSSGLFEKGEFLHSRCISVDVTERKRAERALRESEQRLTSELRVMERLQRLSVRVAETEDFSSLLLEIVDAAIEVTEADKGNVQLFDASTGCLHLAASRGFDRPFLEAFETVRDGRAACGAALRDRARVVVEDVATSDVFAGTTEGDTLRAAGVEAVTATPLLSRAGRLVGMLSVHFGKSRRPSDSELRALDLLARQAADGIERARAEASLSSAQELKARLAAIVESSDDAIVSKDLNGIIRTWNRGAERLFGFTADEAVGQSILMLIPPDRHAEETDILGRIRRGISIEHYETVRRRKDGKMLDISLTVSPIYDVNGTVVGASKIARDITERLRIQSERDALLESERAARGQAERAARARDEFLAVVSHELRTPLHGILGWAQYLKRGAVDERSLGEAVEAIERGARAQAQLIEDLLDVNRITTGRLTLDLCGVHIPAVIDAAIATVRPAADVKNIRIHTVLDTKLGPVTGDPVRLQQVVWNLLSNSVKFTPRNGRIDILLGRSDSAAEITVRDTGVGVAPDFLPYVFERFRQADSSTTRSYSGLGLGLSIVKHIVELHGGTVTAESEGEGKGATFTVRLPLAPVRNGAAHALPSASPAVDQANGVDLDGVCVLVVDDDEESRKLIQRLLTQYKAHVLTAASAREGLEILATQEVDALVSDIGMPQMDGYQFIRSVREELRMNSAKIPALALTAYARSEDRTKAMLAGYQMHLAKPIQPQELVATVASFVGRTHG